MGGAQARGVAGWDCGRRVKHVLKCVAADWEACTALSRFALRRHGRSVEGQAARAAPTARMADSRVLLALGTGLPLCKPAHATIATPLAS